MTPEQTLADISVCLNELVHKPDVGANNIVFYIVSSITELPRNIPKLYVWHVASTHTGETIFNTLKAQYRITNEPNETNTNGQYLYVYERVNRLP